MAKKSELQRNAYWDLNSDSLDKITYDLINELLIEVFRDDPESLTFTELEKGKFLYLEQTGKKDWVWKDPILNKTQDSIYYYNGELPPPENRKIDNLGEISIHESTMEENEDELMIYYQMYIWCWKNLDDLGGCIVLSGLIEKDIRRLGDRIIEKFGFIESID